MKSYLVDTLALHNNLNLILERAGDTPVFAVLKGNGYGLGVEPLSRLCREHGIHHFAVTEVSEARTLREAGDAQDVILMLRPTADPAEIEQLLDLDVIAAVGSYEDAVALNGICTKRGVVGQAHILFDTGMGRYGFLPSELERVFSIYDYLEGIAVCGVFTHLHSSFSSAKKTLRQIDDFRAVIQNITGAGYETGMVHCANSCALFQFPQSHMDAVRVGSAMLGRLPLRRNFGLCPVGVCQAEVETVRWLPKGHTCGYGATWRAKKPTKIAVVGVGWYHGFALEAGRDVFRFRDCIRGIGAWLRILLFGKSLYITINETPCKVLGHIGMLHTVADVTNLDVSAGDPARLAINPLRMKGLPVEYQ